MGGDMTRPTHLTQELVHPGVVADGARPHRRRIADECVLERGAEAAP